MSRLEVVNGRITGWYCTQHNVYNDILTIHCCYCPELRPNSLDTEAIKRAAQREGLMSEPELYEKFFKGDLAFGQNLAETLTFEERQAKIRELEELAYRARVMVTPLRQKNREDKANGKAWLVPSDNASLGELPKRQPSARKSKMDKLRELLAEMSEDGEELIVGLKAKKDEVLAAKRLVDMKSDESALCGAERHSDCTSSFIRNGEKYTCNCECHNSPLRVNSPKTPIVETATERPDMIQVQPLTVEQEVKQPEPIKTPKAFDFSKLRGKQ